jgi:hypothetical protein
LEKKVAKLAVAGDAQSKIRKLLIKVKTLF